VLKSSWLMAKSRPVNAQAMQFRYGENSDETRNLAELIVSMLGVRISISFDPQSGPGYHVTVGPYEKPGKPKSGWQDSKCLSTGGWVVRDNFGYVTVVPDEDFKTYYEPL
jgi:hypothetical protein